MKTRKPRKYTTVSIPISLMKNIEKLVNKEDSEYQNKADFVLDAIRRRLRELGVLG
jgi:Arc/MetJ-type ribon-helix-helix transcriptional regulator